MPAFAALLFAIVPRALTASWVVLGYGLIVIRRRDIDV
jgi:hypothetical protein